MVKNVIEDVVVPESPKVLPNEQLQVYVPTASNTQKGIAKFNDGPFEVVDGEVKIKEEYLNDVIGKGFVAKSKMSNRVYGTDDEGNDVNIPYSITAEANKIVKRSPKGDVVVPIYPTDLNAAISRKYFLEQLVGRVPVVKDVTLDSKFLYSYFYDNAGNSRLVKADSELDSEIAVRLQDGHLRVPYSPLSRFTVDTAVNSKYLLDNYSTTAVINDKIQASEDRLSLNDVDRFAIENITDADGMPLIGKYNFTIYKNNGEELSQEVDFQLDSLKIANVNDYTDEDGNLRLEVIFKNGSKVDVPLDQILNVKYLDDNFIKKLDGRHNLQLYAQDSDGEISLKEIATDNVPWSVVRRNALGEIVAGNDVSSPDAAVSKAYVDGRTLNYDVVTNIIYANWSQVYLKLSINELLDKNSYTFQPFDIVCLGSDGMPMSAFCTIFIEQDDNVYMSVDSFQGKNLAPLYYTKENGNVYLYFDYNGDDFRVYIRGLVQKCTGATLEIVDALPENIQNIFVDNYVKEEDMGDVKSALAHIIELQEMYMGTTEAAIDSILEAQESYIGGTNNADVS